MRTSGAGLDGVHERDAGDAALEPGQVVVEDALHARVAIPVQRGVSRKGPQDYHRVLAQHRGDPGDVRGVVDEGRPVRRPEQLRALQTHHAV